MGLLMIKIEIKERRPLANVDLNEPTVIIHSRQFLSINNGDTLSFDVRLRPVYPERLNAALPTTLTVDIKVYQDVVDVEPQS